MDPGCHFCCWRLSGWAPESREGALDAASLGLLAGWQSRFVFKALGGDGRPVS